MNGETLEKIKYSPTNDYEDRSCFFCESNRTMNHRLDGKHQCFDCGKLFTYPNE